MANTKEKNAPLMFNPVTNNFTTYVPTEPKKVTINLPSYDDPFDISSWASRVTDNGDIVASANTPQAMEVQENLLEGLGDGHKESTTDYIQVAGNLSERKKQAMDFFVGKGLKPIHAAGIVGNLLQESSLNPGAENPSSKAYGIAQWLGSRKTQLQTKYGKNPTFEQQLEFLWEELNTSEKSALNHLLSTTSYEEATNSIMNRFERPSAREKSESITRRLNFAKGLLT